MPLAMWLCTIAVSVATPSTIATSTTCPLPLVARSTSAASTPATRNIDPPPKSARRLSGNTGLRPRSPIALIAPTIDA
jgi:hypothetical protein